MYSFFLIFINTSGIRVFLLLNGSFGRELVVLHTMFGDEFIGACLESVWTFEQRTFCLYILLGAKPILTPLDVPK
jgi:hypothetical protein